MALGQIIGAGIGAAANIWNNKQQTKLQKQFAQQGIQWKVADAKKAGIHPLAALGAQTTSYSPQSLQLGSTLADAGQSVDNAIHRSTDQQTRAMGELQLEKAGLENEYLRAQIISIRSNRTGLPPVVRTNTNPEAPPPEHYGMRDPTGLTTLTDPSASDAQKAEDRYGESADYIEGPRNRFLDFWYSRSGMPYDAYRRLWDLRMREGRARSPQHFGVYMPDTRHYRHR